MSTIAASSYRLCHQRVRDRLDLDVGVAFAARFDREDARETGLLRDSQAAPEVLPLAQLRVRHVARQREQGAQAALARVLVGEVAEVGERADARGFQDLHERFRVLRDRAVVLDHDLDALGAA